ncbi:MAG TPA: hypothetical protein PKL65_14760 [Bacteroidales bacterium]|jgi:hypothetical protein|nr:hypothetical protein [Bacteroidales bacterium]HNR43489.1 hypothetical protein [Bacteroidales bacterium]HQG76742.1 hypothetical protein [Bacteroidales bacterium]
MKTDELKGLILKALETEQTPDSFMQELEEAGVTYTFSNDFSGAVLNRIFGESTVRIAESEFFSNMRLVFNRVALTGIAAIILLLISILLGQGTLSIDSILGIGDIETDSIISLMTGY